MLKKSLRLRSAAVAAAVCVVPMVGVSPASAQSSSDTGVVINEIQPDGTDWIELANRNTNDAVDISGWTLIDDKDSHTPYTFPEGTTIESGGYISIEPDAGTDGFGLGKSGDTVTLKNANGEVMDTFTWESSTPGTFARIPDMTGDFSPNGKPTRDGINESAAEADEPDNSVAFPADPLEIKEQKLPAPFTGEDMSGVDFDAAGNAFVVNNDNGTLFKLSYDAASDSYTIADQWTLKYPDGSGELDTEGVTVLPDGSITVAVERDNANSSQSRPALVHFAAPDPDAETLNAAQEISLAEQVGTVKANGGLEAVEYIAELSAYAVGVEETGEVLLVSVGEDGTVDLKQRYDSPFPGVMWLDYNGGTLRVGCDEVCSGKSLEMTIKDGELVTDGTIYQRPAQMGNFANEGFASFTDASGTRYLWADDAGTDGVALRSAFVATDPADNGTGSVGSLDAALPIVGSLALIGIGGAGAFLALNNAAVDIEQLPLPEEIKALLRPLFA